MNIKIRPAKYTIKERQMLTKFRKKNGSDYRYCQNRRQFAVNSRKPRKIQLQYIYESTTVLDFEVEYRWNGGLTNKEEKRLYYKKDLEIVSLRLVRKDGKRILKKEGFEHSYCKKVVKEDSFLECLLEMDCFKYAN